MKIKQVLILAVLALSTLTSAPTTANAQGTAFTYQGQLSAGGAPANGHYDFTFALFSTSSTNTGQVGATLTDLDVGVTNCLFTVLLDFGANFPGASRWLAIGVRTNGGSGFTALNPLQELTPTPYAIYTPNAGNAASATTFTGPISQAQLPAQAVTNNEAGVTLNNATLNGALNLPANVAFNSGGNVFMYSDNAFDFFAGPGAGNAAAATVYGLATQGNTALGYEAFYYDKDGYGNTACGYQSLFANTNGNYNAAFGNSAMTYNTSGSANTAIGQNAMAYSGTGNNNVAAGNQALQYDEGGNNNTAIGTLALYDLGAYSSPGGSNNIALGCRAGFNLLGNESGNIDIGNPCVTGDSNIIRIGNTQTSIYLAGVVNGGMFSNATFDGALNLPSSVTVNSGGGVFLYSDDALDFFAGPGAGSTAAGIEYGFGEQANTAIGGDALYADNAGYANTACGYYSLFANTNGNYNAAFGNAAMWLNTSGSANTAMGQNAMAYSRTGNDNTAVGNQALQYDASGNNNTGFGTQALYQLGASTGAGGSNNIALGYQAGYNLLGNESSNIDIGNPGVTGESNIIRIGGNQTATYLAGVVNGNGGGLTSLPAINLTGALPALNGANLTNLTLNNPVDSAVASGLSNFVTGSTYSIIAGGTNNVLTNVVGSAILGGLDNAVNASQSAIGSGTGNVIQIGAYYAFLGSGGGNVIATNSDTAFIGAGYHNLIGTNAPATVLGGGQYNSISNNATFAFLGGGYQNTNTGPYSVIPGGINNVAASYSFAAGSNAMATNANAFVWSDGSAVTGSTNASSVTLRAGGGYRLLTSSGASGAFLGANQTSWSAISDRNVKKNFRPVNTKSVLDKLAAIPVQQWNYNWEKDGDVPNIGPMAQDFKAAFYPGRDDKSISTLEFDGVELAAIQGLNQKLEAETKAKDAEIEDLKQSVAELKKMVQLLAERK